MTRIGMWPVISRAARIPARLLLIPLLLVAFHGDSSGAEPDSAQPAYEELLASARQALRDREAKRAAELFRAVLDRTPGRAEAWYGLSKAYEWEGRIDEAITAGERVQELGFVARPRLSYRLAQLHARAGHAEEALQWLERCLEERYENRPGIARDEAFASLRENPRFVRLAGLPPEGELTRQAGWTHDLDYLIEEARRMHADPSRPAESERFQRQAAELREAIPSLTDDGVLAGMMRLVALLDDGHSALYGPAEDSPLAFNRRALPFKFYLFPEGLYVVDGAGEWAAYAGHRVVRFGALSAEEVLRRMSRYRGVDNAMTWRWMGPQFYVGKLLMLREVGATDVPESVAMTLEAPDGKVSKLVVEGGDYEIRRKLRPAPVEGVAPPLYLSRVGTSYWLEPMPRYRALYFQFNQVRNAEGESLSEFADRLAAALARETVDTLIVDVRHNNGGNNGLLRPLIRTLVAFEMGSPESRIVVLAGRNTFSAAQNFINRVERWTDASFVGEPSSSSPNFLGEETELLLPFSRVQGSISTRYWQDSDPGDERAWIDPDIPVTLTAQDYFAGRDPVLDAALARLPRVDPSGKATGRPR